MLNDNIEILTAFTEYWCVNYLNGKLHSVLSFANEIGENAPRVGKIQVSIKASNYKADKYMLIKHILR